MLLWTNEKKENGKINSVNYQEITITDIDKYNAFIIEVVPSDANFKIVTRVLLFKTDGTESPYFYIGGVTGSMDQTVRRIYTTDTGIFFRNPAPSGGAGSLLPIKIYGINIEIN